LTPKQEAAGQAVLEAIRRHNPAPSAEELDAIEREWLED
jgi:hypothetical protein